MHLSTTNQHTTWVPTTNETEEQVLSIEDTPFSLDQKRKTELSFATTSYYNKTFSPSPQTQVPTTKKRRSEGKFFGFKKNWRSQIDVQGRNFLFEEMKDQKSWVGVFFWWWRAGNCPSFCTPGEHSSLLHWLLSWMQNWAWDLIATVNGINAKTKVSEQWPKRDKVQGSVS